jgi:hypothetical protein
VGVIRWRAFYQRDEGSLANSFKGDPSLRLKNGYARDDTQETLKLN